MVLMLRRNNSEYATYMQGNMKRTQGIRIGAFVADKDSQYFARIADLCMKPNSSNRSASSSTRTSWGK